MNIQPATPLIASLCGYVIGAVAGLLFMRREKLANAFAFGAASLSALSSLWAALFFLAAGTGAPVPQIKLLPALIPYIKFTVRLDPLGGVYLASVLDASKLMARIVSRSLLLPKLWRGSPVERYRGKLLLNTHRS